MRPVYVGNIHITPQMVTIAEACLKGLDDIGEPHIATGESHNVIYDAIKSLQAPDGFKLEASVNHGIPDCHLVYGHGSVFPHEDYGFGLCAVTLIYISPESLSLADKDCALFTGGTHSDMGLGDTVIFDTDKEHAWMCNGDWVLASIPVKRVRKSRV
jgi:hypothetical protein